MAKPEDGSPASKMRAAVNSPRGNVVATVAGLSAIGGAVAGGVAALIAVAVLTPSEPVTAAEVVLMAVESGFVAGLAGAALGTLVAFGALRRVALGKLLLFTNVGMAAGLTVGWIAGPWAWHHMGFLGFAGFSAGALLARTVASAPVGVVQALAPPAELVTPINQVADRVRRNVPPER